MGRQRRANVKTLGAVVAGLLIACAAAPAQATLVIVHVAGVTDPRGHIRVELCTRQTFLTEFCPYGGAAPAVVGETQVRVEAPPGEYAVQAFHDETDSGRVHQNLLGIPRERIGFSNDAPLGVRGPRFEAAAFVIGAEVRILTLRLRRLVGG
jgi:uncharacterized protein (DUF2141 family)